jgi:hypothetical protein
MSRNITTNGSTIELGALIGGLFGPEGTLPGALIGSMFGVGGSVSYVPATGSLYAGAVATFGVGISGGSGSSVSAVPALFSAFDSQSLFMTAGFVCATLPAIRYWLNLRHKRIEVPGNHG